MSAHTPAPWKYGWETDSREWAQVTTATGNIIANVNTETGPDLPPLVSAKMPAEANARLISASPDLLAALKECATIIAQNRALGMNQGSEYVYIVDRARAAIAKAEGVPT